DRHVLAPRAARHAQRRASRAHQPRCSRLNAGARIVTRPTWSGERAVKVDRSRLPTPGAAQAFTFPRIEKSVLPNGLRVWTATHATLPIVSLLLLVSRGSANDPPGQEGLAAMTTDMLDEGSGSRSAIEIHADIARIGAQFDNDI